MDELIRAVLTELAKGSDEDAVKDIPIVSNGVRRDATGKWFVTWRHPDRYGLIFPCPSPILSPSFFFWENEASFDATMPAYVPIRSVLKPSRV